MMRSLVDAALRLRVVVLALAIVLMIVGTRAALDTPLDVFPEFAPPLVEIQTEAPGLSTSEVESLVTVPLENAMNGIVGLRTLRSKSVLGLSSVVMIFEDGTDLMPARQLVQERLTRVASSLPAAVSPPVILSPLSSLSRVLKIGITSDRLSQMDLTTLATWTIRPRLMSIAGVANVAIWGQRDRQLQVLVDPDRLRASHVTLTDLLTAARDGTAVAAGGFLETPQQRLAVAHASSVASVADLRQVVIPRATPATGFRPALRIGDVADVVEGSPPPIGDAIINDVPGLLLIVEKHPDGNTLQVTRDVEAALEALKPGLPNVAIDSTIFRPATFIEMALRNLNRALIIGLVLVMIVLAVFLYDWRTALISLIAIPLSLVAAALILRYRGGTLDTMVIAGLIIALGEVVDDAIIDVENIVRRLRLNAAAGHPRSAFDVVLDASVEVRSAVVYGSAIVVLVFVPVFLLEGLAGAFFRPLALSYVLAILASLLVALVVTPALSLMLLPRAVGGARAHGDAPLVRWLKTRYRRVLPPLMHAPRQAIATIAVALGVTAVAYPFLGEEFLPHFQEYDFLMHWVEKPGTSLNAMNRVTVLASKELRAVPGVRNFGSHVGRAEVADEVVGINFTELWISLEPDVDYDATVARIQSVVDGYPGLTRDLLTYLRERIKEVLTGASATIVVRIYGPNLDQLGTKAAEVGRALSGIDGISDLAVQQMTLVPQVQIRMRPEAAQLAGVTAGRVRETLATLLRGSKVGEIYDDQKVFDVVVWSVPSIRSDIFAIKRLPIDLPGGGYVPLEVVADVSLTPTPNEITRQDGSRRIDVTTNVRGRDLGAVALDIKAALATVPFEAGYHPEVLGEYAEREASQNRLLLLGALSLLGILLVLHIDFGSMRLVTIVALTLPFALIGGVAAAFLSGGILSLGSLVGFVTVLGIAARNGIMLVSHYRHLEESEGMAFGPDLVLRGAEERLAPILMTALATGLALVPIVVGGSRSGQEVEHPMAVIILGGLFTSTVLNLFLLPAIYLRYGRRAAPADHA